MKNVSVVEQIGLNEFNAQCLERGMLTENNPFLVLTHGLLSNIFYQKCSKNYKKKKFQ